MCLCYDSGNKVAVIVIMVIIKFMNTSLLVLILVAFFLANYQSLIEISILEGCTCVGIISGAVQQFSSSPLQGFMDKILEIP